MKTTQPKMEMLIDSSALSGISLISVLIAVLLLVIRVLSVPNKLGKALPTPGGLPWLGPVWAVDASSIYRTFKAWADRLGPLYEVTLFGQNLIIVADPLIAKEILSLRAKSVSDRPSIALVDHSKVSGKYLPFLGNNNQLAQQRKFGVSMNNWTARKSYHGRMLPEAVQFLDQLVNQSDEPFILLEQLCRRLSSRMAFGNTAAGAAITRSAHNLMKNLSPGGRITNTLRFLKYLPVWLSPEKRNEALRIEVEDRVWSGAFQCAKTEYQKGTLLDCYVKYYFEDQEKIGMSETDAIYGIGMMATVSILTITAPIQKWLIAMSEHPEWQLAVQRELDEVLGGRLADVDDSPLLPTLRATLVESIRWVSPIPTGIPHRLEADMEFDGYHLSKGSNVLAVDWAMSRSEAHYKDADKFNPARYLDPSSYSYREPLTEYPKLQGQTAFGWGRRTCVGQEYVAAQMLVTCAAILWGFNISHGVDPRTGEKVKINIENATPHVIPIMDPVDLRFTPRSEMHAQRVRDAWGMIQAADQELQRRC